MQVVVIDETMFPYRGKCPVKQVIPGKPGTHSEGMLVYFMAGYSTQGDVPFVLDITPILPEHQPSPSAAAKELVERMKQIYPTNVVVDAAFGSQALVLLCKNKGHGAICSVNTGVQDPWLWKWMKWNLAMKEGRVLLCEENGVAASIFCGGSSLHLYNKYSYPSHHFKYFQQLKQF